MSLVCEINKIINNNEPDGTLRYDDSDLYREYQALLDRGIIKKRGFTLQTLEEKQMDVPEIRTFYNTTE